MTIPWELVPEEIRAVGFSKDGISANIIQTPDETGWEWSVSHLGMRMSFGSCEQSEQALKDAEAAIVRVREALDESTTNNRKEWDQLREAAQERDRKKREELREAVHRHNAILQGIKEPDQE